MTCPEARLPDFGHDEVLTWSNMSGCLFGSWYRRSGVFKGKPKGRMLLLSYFSLLVLFLFGSPKN